MMKYLFYNYHVLCYFCKLYCVFVIVLFYDVYFFSSRFNSTNRPYAVRVRSRESYVKVMNSMCTRIPISRHRFPKTGISDSLLPSVASAQ